MTSFVERQIQHFNERLDNEALVRRQDGKVVLDPTKLSAIVRSEPKLAELYVKTYSALARQGKPQDFQIALMVATAYQLEFDDSSLVEYVSSAAEGQSIKIGIDGQGGTVEYDVNPGQGPAMRVLRINDTDPVNGDVTNLIGAFRTGEQHPANARQLKGLVALDFPGFAKDPRPDFLIPEIRACIEAIDVAFPYFLYYIVPRAQAGQVTIYTNSLLPLNAFKLLPGKWQYKGTTADVAFMLIPRMLAVQEFCRRTGDNDSEVIEGLLGNFPADFAKTFMDALRS